MDIWTLLNPILKLGFYLSVVGTVGTALFFFHFKKILEKQNVEFCKNLMFFSSGFGLIICLLFFISLGLNLIVIYQKTVNSIFVHRNPIFIISMVFLLLSIQIFSQIVKVDQE